MKFFLDILEELFFNTDLCHINSLLLYRQKKSLNYDEKVQKRRAYKYACGHTYIAVQRAKREREREREREDKYCLREP